MITKKTQIFFAVFAVIIIIASLVSYYRFVIKKDFTIFLEENNIPSNNKESFIFIKNNTKDILWNK
ncbi:MAG TPA: hypothetical protein PLQ20_00675 [Candidatus Paceibacterota bacterium]|nr:hypothetical protein [Candidatus Paceibacterota bacterium]